MTIGPYHVSTALRLLDPADFGPLEPRGCLDHLSLMIKKLAISILRIINCICGDHQWYDNRTAAQMVNQFIADNNPNLHDHPLYHPICQLSRALQRRANSHLSDLQGVQLLQLNAQTSPALSLTELTGSSEFNKDSLIELALEQMYNMTAAINDTSYRNRVLCLLAETQASIHPEKALQITGMIHDELKDEIFCAIAVKYARTDFEKSMAFLNRMHHPISKQDASRECFEIAAAANPEHFLDFVNQHMEDAWKILGLCAAAKAQAISNPQAAKEILYQAIDIVNLIEHETKKNALLCEILKELAAIDPDEAMATSHLVNECFKAELLYRIAEAQAAIDPAQALQTTNMIQNDLIKSQALYQVVKAQAKTCPEEAKARILDIQNDFLKGLAFSTIAQTQALTSIDQALDTINCIDDLHYKNQSLYKIVRIHAKINPDRALEIADTIEDLEYRHSALCVIAKNQASTNIEQATATVNLIQHDLSKAKGLCIIAKVLASKNATQANRLFMEGLDLAMSGVHPELVRCEAICKIVRALAD
jgi:hypothetical protein